MLRAYDATARYVDQGGNKRPGAFAIYLEPWHADIFDFLDLRKNHGKEEARARDLFYALWIPDLLYVPSVSSCVYPILMRSFSMKRAEVDGDWTLFCPSEAPGLFDCHGNEFEALYARSVSPVLGYHSYSLSYRYEREGRGRKTIKAQKLFFAITEAQIEARRPFMVLHMPFESLAAKELNIQVFETIYHAACEASMEMAIAEGPYETWEGSPASQGKLQFDLWGVTPTSLWEWTELKEKIVEHGMRNSLLLSPMPTASTSQILGFNECFEPYTKFVVRSLY